MISFGNLPLNTTIPIFFSTFGSSNESITISGLATSDIKIYKNGSTTERSSTSGFTLLDTDGIDFDGLTGIHGFSIDTSDNTDAGFYAAGAFYWVVISSITVNSQTVSFVAASFRLVAAENTAGTPVMDAVRISGDATAADNCEAFFDGTGYAGTNNVIPTVTTLTGHTAQTGDSYAIVSSGTHGNAALKTLIDTVDNFVDTEIADIQARLPAALTSGGYMKSDVLAVNGDATGAANLAKTTRAIGRGTVTTGGTPTSVPTSSFTPNGAVADQFKGRIITFDANTSTAALQGQSTDITASTSAANPTFTVTALTTAPSNGDTFSVT